MKRDAKREDEKRKELQRRIDKLDDANPQHRITKERYKVELEALDKKLSLTKSSKINLVKITKKDKPPVEKPSTSASPLPSPLTDTSQTNKTIKLPSESLSNADHDAQNKSAYRKNRTSSVAEVEHKISSIRRLIERRAAIHGKMTQQLEIELGHVVKASEAMTLLKKRIDDSFAALERDLAAVKARQVMDVKGMKEQLKVVEKQSTDNAELEKCARRMSDTMVKNQVPPIGMALLSPIIDAVKGVLYQLAKLRDAYKVVLRSPSSTKSLKVIRNFDDNKELAL
uniref:Dynactin domain-containing protein n=1 Tax=Panagrellus redivivus TaxID=6233 RepID=A0A7E4VIL9_PANRE